MDEYLSKPITIKQLTQVLERQTANNPARARSTQASKIKAPGNNQIVERGTFEALSKLADDNGSSDFLASITSSYVDQATRIADDLPKMLDSGDLISLQSVAHQLKSNSGYLGAQRVSRGAEALEHAVREGHTMPQLCVLMEQLRTNVREAVPEILDLAREMSG
jgi:HPt (histidine-containing phosphotransfer) domain-containing protein